MDDLYIGKCSLYYLPTTTSQCVGNRWQPFFFTGEILLESEIQYLFLKSDFDDFFRHQKQEKMRNSYIFIVHSQKYRGMIKDLFFISGYI